MPDSPNDQHATPTRLSVVTRDGQAVISTPYPDPAASMAEDRRRLKKLMDKAKQAPPGDTVPYGYIAFMGRRHMSSLQDLMEARHEEGHRTMWVQDLDGADCTACACGVLVRGRVNKDFTEQEFRDAEGHIVYVEPEQDPMECPRCGRGLPNDRAPGSGSGFWSLTTQPGYVCEGCHDHQVYLGYSPPQPGRRGVAGTRAPAVLRRVLVATTAAGLGRGESR